MESLTPIGGLLRRVSLGRSSIWILGLDLERPFLTNQPTVTTGYWSARWNTFGNHRFSQNLTFFTQLRLPTGSTSGGQYRRDK
ncbi:MAG: hypothetical protein BWY82_01510 [Verrucomicrobia bacterium ADurb.Bin474]|nr:MAG: hypothetical protein BWY82_01510 [Verrucomicrobia bacterium ADurb.Bin474]